MARALLNVPARSAPWAVLRRIEPEESAPESEPVTATVGQPPTEPAMSERAQSAAVDLEPSYRSEVDYSPSILPTTIAPSAPQEQTDSRLRSRRVVGKIEL